MVQHLTLNGLLSQNNINMKTLLKARVNSAFFVKYNDIASLIICITLNTELILRGVWKERYNMRNVVGCKITDWILWILHRAYISELERGLLLPSLETFFKLAYELKIKPRDLADKIDQKLKL